ncbi:hypothetical protein [Paludisphaera rhizosphaerae]|uniref:hypothetical protein n=1 Tax=Paludisphaera rhizosphaerae TaxID=2711216 RepID=UPI0013ED836F|nr:hypothetical protein [Paludisphaera rhizosphaerae]
MTTRWAESDFGDCPKKGPMRWWTRRILGMRPAFVGVATPLLAAVLAVMGSLEQATSPANVPRRPLPPYSPPVVPMPSRLTRTVVVPREAWTIDPQMIHQARSGVDEAMIHQARPDVDPRMVVPTVPEAVTAPVPVPGYTPIPTAPRFIPPPPVPGFPVVPHGPRFRGPGGTIPRR